MARKTYDDATKAAFIKAATDARAAEKSWSDAYAAAKEAGYGGSLGGIKQMLLKVSEGAKPASTGNGRRRGRPRRGRPPLAGRPRRGRPPGTGAHVGAAAGLAPLEQIIDSLVRQRVDAVLAKAIEALKEAAAKA